MPLAAPTSPRSSGSQPPERCLDLPQRDGITPLMVAVGAGASSTDTRGKFRTELDALETADALLAAGAAVDELDARGRTALHYAAAAGYTDVAKRLVEQGANLLVADADGVRPLDAANGKLRGGRRGGNRPIPQQPKPCRPCCRSPPDAEDCAAALLHVFTAALYPRRAATAAPRNASASATSVTEHSRCCV